jgi:antitoxin HigA-1
VRSIKVIQHRHGSPESDLEHGAQAPASARWSRAVKVAITALRHDSRIRRIERIARRAAKVVGVRIGLSMRGRGSAAELARQLGVPTNRITEILNRPRAITGDTALHLAHFCGTSAEFWLNLQSLYAIRLAEQRSGKSIRALPSPKSFEQVRA